MDDEQRQDVVARLFALITAKLEDGAALATQGQGSDLGPARQSRWPTCFMPPAARSRRSPMLSELSHRLAAKILSDDS